MRGPKLDLNKATGYDTIPIKMMKIGASELARPLSVIFNAGIDEAKWPTEGKKGNGHLSSKGVIAA